MPFRILPIAFATMFAFSFLTAARAQALSLNDVSVLLPLPTAATFAQLLSPGDQAAAGVLIPRTIFNQFGRFVQKFDLDALYLEGFKVVALRIDPCFVEGFGPHACRHQIRLVWQPVVEGNHGFTTLDAALHSFYEFTDEAEWQAILRAWPLLARNSLAMQVHPAVAAETLGGPFWQKIKAVILHHCGEQKLVRLTAMSSNATANAGSAPAIVWLFQGFDISGSQFSRHPIARIGRPTQVLINTDTTTTEFVGHIQPQPPPSAWNDFLTNSVTASAHVDLKDVINSAFENENPQRQNAGTVDCVSCHVSQEIRRWGETRFATAWNWNQDFPARYRSPLNLQNTGGTFGTNRLRSFGYFGQDPVISQRLINETAAIVQSFGGG